MKRFDNEFLLNHGLITNFPPIEMTEGKLFKYFEFEQVEWNNEIFACKKILTFSIIILPRPIIDKLNSPLQIRAFLFV